MMVISLFVSIINENQPQTKQKNPKIMGVTTCMQANQKLIGKITFLLYLVFKHFVKHSNLQHGHKHLITLSENGK